MDNWIDVNWRPKVFQTQTPSSNQDWQSASRLSALNTAAPVFFRFQLASACLPVHFQFRPRVSRSFPNIDHTILVRDRFRRSFTSSCFNSVSRLVSMSSLSNLRFLQSVSSRFQRTVLFDVFSNKSTPSRTFVTS